jgi:hypothetical protein
MAAAAVEHTGMSERPWWFPTAVFVAPVAAVLSMVGVASAVRCDEPVWSTVLLGAPVVPFLDLARREDRWRDRERPSHVNRWGAPAVQTTRPFWRAGREVAWAVAAVVLVLVWTFLMIAMPDGARGLAFALSVAGFILLGLGMLVWSLRNGLVETRDPFWMRQVTWRWPVTTAAASLTFWCVVIVGSLGELASGGWFALVWILVAGLSIRGPVARLRDRMHPDRHYGRRIGVA